jgi:hypothetical protein
LSVPMEAVPRVFGADRYREERDDDASGQEIMAHACH